MQILDSVPAILTKVGTEQPFVFLPAQLIGLNNGEQTALSELRMFWNKLPPDNFTRAKAADGKSCQRSRAFARLEFFPETSQLKRLQDVEFRQGQNNQYAPGVSRRFGIVPDDVLENLLLQELVRFSWTRFEILQPWDTLPWEVGVHLILTHGAFMEDIHVTPEGPHTDGFAFATMASFGQLGLSEDSGITEISNNSKQIQPIVQIRLSRPMDLLFVDDTRVLHYVTPIRGLQKDSYRDAMVLTWHQNDTESPYQNRNKQDA